MIEWAFQQYRNDMVMLIIVAIVAGVALGSTLMWFLAFIGALQLDPVAIVGHSYGGSVSLAMAVKHPELVDRLFLYEASLSFAARCTAGSTRVSTVPT
jgi:pimeloyl-ACP methyl ester carboxylesterase